MLRWSHDQACLARDNLAIGYTTSVGVQIRVSRRSNSLRCASPSNYECSTNIAYNDEITGYGHCSFSDYQKAVKPGSVFQ
jgi:hypothetical protein